MRNGAAAGADGHRPQIFAERDCQQPLGVGWRYGGARGRGRRPRADFDGPALERCMNFNNVSWGYNSRQECRYRGSAGSRISCARCNLLLNFGPIRHGESTRPSCGGWGEAAGEDGGGRLWHTRAGPWQPVDGKYGYTQRQAKSSCMAVAGRVSAAFTTPAIDKRVVECRDVYRATVR